MKQMSTFSEYPPKNDHGRRPPISPGLQRALVFALLGPVFGVLAALLMATAAREGTPCYVIPLALFFSLIICAVTGPVDGVLAYLVPVSLRVPLTAMFGATVAVGLGLFLETLLGIGTSPPPTLIPVAVIGALSTGASSLLSHHRLN
jgi:hypothetical protein